MDIGDVVAHVVETQPAGAVTVEAEPGEAPTHGNAVLLERLVQNLVENGVRYNVPAAGYGCRAARSAARPCCG